jgi:predicted DNA-binding transcriptional regulator YafY
MRTLGSALEKSSGTTQAKDHERLSNRLAQLLDRLYQGEQLHLADLALEFGVTLRTLQRDLARIGQILPVQRTGGAYQLAPDRPRPQALRELQRFAEASGLQGMYPRFDSQMIQELTKGPGTSALQVHGPQYEEIRPRARLFDQIEQAIKRCRRISFVYTKTDGTKTVEAAPYQFINHSGIWYLAAVDGNRLKAYSFGKIDRLLVSDEVFARDATIEKQLREEGDIWLNEKKVTVVLEIKKEATQYFMRRPLIDGQILERKLDDGSIIISGKAAHPNQILPIVRYWIPNARIISPEWLEDELDKQLQIYLERR